MTVRELLNSLGQRGIRLEVDGETLRCKAPTGALTAELGAQIRQHKAELIALLAASSSTTRSERREEPIDEFPEEIDAPLSFAQERMWFTDQLLGSNHTYNISIALPLMNQSFDLDILSRCCQTLIQRHRILRSVFRQVSGEVRQIVLDDFQIQPEVLTLRRTYGPGELTERDYEIREIMQDQARRRFDLQNGPMVRVVVVKLSPHDHIVLLLMHHIVSDGWSNIVIIRELSTLYETYLRGLETPLAKPPIQYRDFAAWQRRRLNDDELLLRQVNYWKQQLTGLPPLLELPYDRPRPQEQRHVGRTLAFEMDEESSRRLNELAQHYSVSLFMLLLAANHVLLSRYTHRRDIAVGSPLANRQRAELEEMVGPCINTMVLRTDVDGALPFPEYLKKVRRTVLEAFDNNDVPYERIVSELEVPRTLSFEPLVQVTFLLKAAPPGAKTIKNAIGFNEQFGFSMRDVSGSSKMDLTVMTQMDGDTLQGWFEYNSDLFDEATIERMIAHYKNLLLAIIDQPERPIRELPMLTAEEQKVLTLMNGGGHDLDQCVLVPRRFAQQAAATPQAVAIIGETSQYTYAEADAWSNRMSRALMAEGLQAGQRVVVCLDRHDELPLLLMAILKAGAAYCPVDPATPPQRLLQMAEDLNPAVVLAHERYCPLFTDWSLSIVDYDALDLDCYAADDPEIDVSPEDEFSIFFTSGSTGRPKGVVLRHGGVANQLQWMQERFLLDPNDRILMKTRYTFDASCFEMFWPVLNGAAIVVARDGGEAQAEYLATLCQRHQVTITGFVPSILTLFLNQDYAERMRNLRTMLAYGEALTPDVVEKYARHFDCPLHNLYGPSECTIVISGYQVIPERGERLIPIGRPVSGNHFYVLDQNRCRVPLGAMGELYISGVQVGAGYAGRPDLTAAAFIENPFAADDGCPTLYRTGDLVRVRADGEVEYLGREDFQVKLRGVRIELEEIESVLKRQPSVRDAAVTVIGDKEEANLAALIVPREAHSTLDEHALRQGMRESLPDFMIPAILFTVTELPLSANGKLNRKQLPELVRGNDVLAGDLPPENEIEEQLLELWTQLLERPVSSVNANFFVVGGHSLLIMRLAFLIETAFEIRLQVRELFEASTVRDQGRLIERALVARQVSGGDDEADTEEKRQKVTL